MSDRFSRIMNHEIGKINKHLPVQSLNLSQVLKLKEPGYLNRSKEFVTFDKSELDFIKTTIPETYYKNLQLPIYLTRRRDLGRGIYVIAGGDVCLYLIQKCLNPDIEDYFRWSIKKKEKNLQYVYNYQIAVIRRKLPTTTVQAFA